MAIILRTRRGKPSWGLMRAADDWVKDHSHADDLTFHEPSGLPISADYIWDKQRGGRRTYPARFLFTEFLPDESALLEEYRELVQEEV